MKGDFYPTYMGLLDSLKVGGWDKQYQYWVKTVKWQDYPPQDKKSRDYQSRDYKSSLIMFAETNKAYNS